MDAAEDMEIDVTNQQSINMLPRCYQVEALEKAQKENTIVFLETGSGKTLIAIMLLKSYSYLFRKPSPFIAVFLVPSVVLVTQQANEVQIHTDLKVGKYWGEMGVDQWDEMAWTKELQNFQVFVMTPQILLNCLRRSFMKIESIKILIFDECHEARKNSPYACILKEFYHRNLQSGIRHLPRILGLTASLVQSKVPCSADAYWETISSLENLLHSKVYTCVNDSVLAGYIPIPQIKINVYKEHDIADWCRPIIVSLDSLEIKHAEAIGNLDLDLSVAEKLKKKLHTTNSHFVFCVTELGLWLSMKAAESIALGEKNLNGFLESNDHPKTIIKDFCKDALQMFSSFIPSDFSICDNLEVAVDFGILTPKVLCLIQSLKDYRASKDMRCIIFVTRVITAKILPNLLRELFSDSTGWKVDYISGMSHLNCRSQLQQNNVVDEFRKGNVNIVVATSILEQGLNVQSCNLVIRYDLSDNVCSFIQSRGRARSHKSDFLLLVKSGDSHTMSLVGKYLSSGDIMRNESLIHSLDPCIPIESNLFDEEYRVESTGATVNLYSSISLLYLYCARLPSDGYFKPTPRFAIDREMETCTIYLPKNCPISTIKKQCSGKNARKITCLEACKQLHMIGALTDNLVPDIDQDIAVNDHVDIPNKVEKTIYFPPELVNDCANNSTTYYCYIIEMEKKFTYDLRIQRIFLLVRNMLEDDVGNINFDLQVRKGLVSVQIKFAGEIELSHKNVKLLRRFQNTVFGALLGYEISSLFSCDLKNGRIIDYFFLPVVHGKTSIDWNCIRSAIFSSQNVISHAENCLPSPKEYSLHVHTKKGKVCRCNLLNSLVCTPHTGNLYCVDSFLYNLDGNSILKGAGKITYSQYFKLRHKIELQFEDEPLLKARRIFQVQTFQRDKKKKDGDSWDSFVELPPELCEIIMSPISPSTLYSFSYVPLVMHRVESMLIASNFKRIYLDEFPLSINIPTMKVLEAITTKKCLEKFHLESLELLGDSFLKYATSQYLFQTFQHNHEGLLSLKRERIISNVALCQLGFNHNLASFIRNVPFNPKDFIIPGTECSLEEELVSSKNKIYIRGTQILKRKTVADVVEALIGAFLSSGGENAALFFMNWLGIEIDFLNITHERYMLARPDRIVNLNFLQSILKYEFRDPSLLVEALTHGSYMLPEIPRCYQRLEYLGDALLDYLITVYLYNLYPGLTPGVLTDLRSATVNNECYSISSVKAGLYKQLLHLSTDLHKQIAKMVTAFEESPPETHFGWETESSYPKVLGDMFESVAGAIFVDSGYNKDVVFNSMRPLLEPLITPATLKRHPVSELHEVCQSHDYDLKKRSACLENGVYSVTMEVDANGETISHTCSSSDRLTAKKLASKHVLMALKRLPTHS